MDEPKRRTGLLAAGIVGLLFAAPVIGIIVARPGQPKSRTIHYINPKTGLPDTYQLPYPYITTEEWLDKIADDETESRRGKTDDDLRERFR